MSQRDKYAELFADYMIEAMQRTGLRQADIARSAKLSRQTISQLVGKKPHQLTGKLLLPERETVEAIAAAFGDDPSIARKAAGYSDATPDAEPYETVEETLRNALIFAPEPCGVLPVTFKDCIVRHLRRQSDCLLFGRQ